MVDSFREIGNVVLQLVHFMHQVHRDGEFRREIVLVWIQQMNK